MMAKDSDGTKPTIEDVDRVIREHERKDVTPPYSVRPEGANHQWRKISPGELSIASVADERLGRVTDLVEAS
jgi:hypothetical protein